MIFEYPISTFNIRDLDDVEQVVRPEDESGHPVDGQPRRALQVGCHDPPVVALPPHPVDGATRRVDPEDEVVGGERGDRYGMANVAQGWEKLLLLGGCSVVSPKFNNQVT